MSAKAPTLLAPDRDGIVKAARLLADGGLVALPSETVYGLAADARNDRAVARIYEAKGRPSFNPLIVHVADMAAVERIAEMPGAARRLAAAFWPGPMTLVLPLRATAGLSPLVTAGLPTVALRLPAHPVMRAVLAAFGGPVAAPSANPSGRISATRAEHVIAGLGAQVDAVLDAGPCAVGVESTILAPAPGGLRLLREGGLTREAITNVAGPVQEDVTPGKVEAPGQLSSHYAPEVAVRLGGAAQPGDITVGFGPGAADLTLSETGDLVEAATRLFDVLHAADRLAADRQARAIRVSDIPDEGLGRAINDRLRRAAAPR
ncbi:YrdC/Sua5 family protein, required for threonylcarbamoyladenosine (t(6)A) formation in tRNA [Roseibacterium elongatum DSM 19469]|uniref:Threonylcarbamoyl-AMP synthase n=1 Tax=Roseicyclus elongatus DSM 19469 TaxID=1294273 RepID=W8SKQ6_9RHOB|nr:L-threonylcarbamoyladenylate synthase [Roseibacterium elongatum]AHM03110.1 YrdC/Sua5 family protein, required for threonylcarbamoyladenosine (t(6)A) formation in tRNA [Roseibacterium elongatum DSM 19469]